VLWKAAAAVSEVPAAAVEAAARARFKRWDDYANEPGLQERLLRGINLVLAAAAPLIRQATAGEIAANLEEQREFAKQQIADPNVRAIVINHLDFAVMAADRVGGGGGGRQ
jgi:hypothetical protein